ncbi:MAG: ABC transporter substrate-binding protein [Chloroflexi bacterium]|nr:ABC transporter substrate-binding protein [Chloroflexota bacterium]
MRKMFTLLSLLVVASMALAACGGTSTQAPATGGDATQAPGDTSAPSGFHAADTTTLVVAESEVGIDTLDPALAYDTASGEIIQNVYETLVFYDGDATDKFVPQLASEMPTVSADGTTYTFKIRSGVKFHNGDVMTPSDVAYSFQRGLLQGGTSSPQWLLTEPFYGVGVDDVSLLVDPEGNLYDDREALSAADPATLVAACEQTKAAIVADDAAGTVTMTLKQAWGPFLPTIAQTWGSVMDQKWVVENGGWDGSCDTWQNFYGMASADDPLSGIANGTGAFTLDKFANGEEIDLVRFADYWREPSKLERVIFKQVPEWGTRFAMMQAGDADLATVPSANRSQMDALVGIYQVFDTASNTYGPEQEVCGYDETALGAAKFTPCAAGETGNGGQFRLRIGRPVISMDVLLSNWNIATSEESPNPYIGSGKLDGNGIPADFFSDVHIRKAFGYCFDFDTLLNDVFSGEAVQSFQLPLAGMPGYFPDTPHYTFDLAQCEAEFKLADLDKDGIAAGDDPEGDVWTTGFRVQMAYNQGNSTRQTIAEILAGNLASVNELFLVETLGLPWPAYLRSQRAKQLPLMTGGWQEDIHDPHNWYQPYTTGTYGGRQSLPDDVKAQFRDILERGVSETDPAKRAEIYKEANTLYYDLAVGIPLEVTTSHGFSQRWLQGVVLNPILSGNYYYPMYKE